MATQTDDIAAGLTEVLAPVDQFAVKVLMDAELYGSTSAEFSVAQHITWKIGSETVDMTVLITGLQPTPGYFKLLVDFTGNGSEVLQLLHQDYIINWILSILSANGWENVPPEHPNQKARVTWDEGFVFSVRRPAAVEG